MIVVLCEHCHQQIQVGEDALGRQVRCPLCGQTGTAALAAAEPIEEIDDTGEGLIPLADDDGTITPFSDEQAAADEQLLR